ncbi:MAG: hypothetical protein R3B09_12730 [Nannocystaceae bacterium]
MHAQAIDPPHLPDAVGPPVSLLICRFEDRRGERFHSPAVLGAIPVAHLLYSADTYHYPDRLVMTRGNLRGRPQLTQGPLDTALPDLLAATLGRARPRWQIEVTASKDRCRSGGDAAYVIDGAIRRTELKVHMNMVPLGVLGVLGAPTSFVDFVAEVDVEVRRADGGEAWAQTFRADARKATGLYYNRFAAPDLLSALVTETVQGSVEGAIHVAERGL